MFEIHGIAIPPELIELHFVRSSGPGGQNVNKVATACQLRFDVARCETLHEDVRRRLMRLAGSRASAEGSILIDARRYRTQKANRDDALGRLRELLLAAMVPPKKRRATRPTRASQIRRVDEKVRRGRVKRLRRPPSESA